MTDDVLERMMDNRSGRDNRVLRGHSGPVYSTTFTPDKNLCASASEDGTGSVDQIITIPSPDYF